MKVTDFYNTEMVDYASYSTLRMLGSAIDGQKNVHRKILYTIIEKNIKTDIKVSQLNSKMAEFAEYLHGDSSDAISRMAQEFAGTNNVPLLVREGNFGTRFKPVPSAPRYIYTYGSTALWELFDKNDNAILEKQYFEGNQIEPKFYLPDLPLLVINGSEGTATGFAQKILSRNPKKVKQYMIDYLNGSLRPNSKNSLEPYFEGFNGTVEQGENPAQWLIKGTAEILSATKVMITEVPVGTTLNKYIETLDKLEESGFIKSYKDMSNKTFKFEITFLKSTLEKLDIDTLLTKLKLTKTVTENYTAIDEDLRVKEFDGIKDIIDYYIEIKMKYLQKRKDYIIESLTNQMNINLSRFYFIKAITEDKLKVNKVPKNTIIGNLEKFENIIPKDGSYDFLLNMPIYSLTLEKMNALDEKIEALKKEISETEAKTLNQMWLENLSSIRSI